MIQQHFLQQQRLNYNHDRLLDRYRRLLSPKPAEFRPFGASSLPGRNYDQHLEETLGHDRRRNSLVAQSRAGISSSNETYRLMGGGGGASETLPRNINSVMQHSRSQSVPLVHAERFEPVQFYEHPVYGPTPSYIRPIFKEKQDSEELNDNYSDKEDSDNDDDNEVRSSASADHSLKIENKDETKDSSTLTKNDDDDDDDNKIPKGYISYKKWKAKYANLIPVNPLLFNIYTKRRNGSINKYGQSLYASPPRHRPANLDDDIFTQTTSEIESISSETPHETSLSSKQKYNRLNQKLPSISMRPRPLESIRAESESSDNESSPPDSPVPYLSRNRQSSFPSTPLTTTIPRTPISPIGPPVPSSIPSSSAPFSITRPSTPTITSTDPVTSTAPTVNTSDKNMIDTSPTTALDSPTPSNIPPAPPFPPSLATTSSTSRYEKPSSIPITSPPSAPPMPISLTTSNSTTPYQTASSVSFPPPSTSSMAESTTKAVTFAGVPTTPVVDNDISSSSDSEDEGKQKRRRRRKRQAAGDTGVNGDSSSSDD